jgi:hypothetical protein
VKRFPKCVATCRMVLCIVLIAPAVAGAQAAPKPKAAWTLMVYLDADNNLERPMIKNLKDMLTVGSTDKINIVALVARSGESTGLYTDEAVGNLPDWTSTKLLRVERNNLRELDDWGTKDMADSRTLAKFLEYSAQNYPAERYGVIFGDHGLAWAGVAVTESHAKNSLTLAEIGRAFERVKDTTGRFELIGFDACLMGNLEVAEALVPYARYLVASEEVEPADGWDYAALLQELTRSPSMDGRALGVKIVDTYNHYFQSGSHELKEKARAITLAVIDLDQVRAVDEAVTNLGNGTAALLARNDHGTWLKVAHARHAAEEYGRSGSLPGTGRPGAEVYDLVNVAANLKVQAADKTAAAAADAVTAAVGRAVVYRIHGDARPRSSGLSIFFPPDQPTLAMRILKSVYGGIDFAVQNSWGPFLAKYESIPLSDQERNRPKPAVDPIAAGGRMATHDEPVKFASHVPAAEIEEASFVLSRTEQGTRIIIGAIPVEPDADGRLEEEWDGEWFTIRNEDVELIAPITSYEVLTDKNGVEEVWAAVPAELRVAGTDEWLDVTLSFVLDVHGEEVTGEFIYAVEYTDEGPREIDLERGDALRPVYEVIDAAGRESLGVSRKEADVITIGSVDDLQVERHPVHPGRYQVGFQVRDFTGRHSERFVEVDVP